MVLEVKVETGCSIECSVLKAQRRTGVHKNKNQTLCVLNNHYRNEAIIEWFHFQRTSGVTVITYVKKAKGRRKTITGKKSLLSQIADHGIECASADFF